MDNLAVAAYEDPVRHERSGRDELLYCPYTDSDLAMMSCSQEHIIPLSLGGANGFEVPVSKAFNSKVGSEIDGAMANDFLTMMRRNKYDVRGHSGRRPVHIAKNAYDAETLAPLQVHLDQRDGLKVWSPADKKFIAGDGPRKLSVRFKLDLDLHLRFTAKVALSAGYFTYRELFRTAVKHGDFRAIMNHPSGAPAGHLTDVGAMVDSMFHPAANERMKVIRSLCKASSPYSIVGLVPSRDKLGVFVGILGEYIGMMFVAAETFNFPNEDAFRWGHVIQLQSTGMARCSFMTAVSSLAASRHERKRIAD